MIVGEDRAMELENEVKDLCKTVDSRDRIIAQLERDLEISRRYGENENFQQSELLVSDLESSRNEMVEYRNTISKLQSKLSYCSVENERINNYNKQLEDQIKTQKSQFDEQKKKLISVEKLANDTKRAQKDEIGDQYKLELENQTLREAIKDLEENEEDLVSEIEILSIERHTLELKQIDQYKTSETLQNNMDENLEFCASLEAEKLVLENTVEAEQKAANQCHIKLQELRDHYDIKLKNITSALREEREKNSAFDSKKLANLPIANQDIKREDQSIDKQEDMNILRKTIQEYRADKDKLEEDLESTCQALHNARNERKSWLNEKLSGGQSKIQCLTATLELAMKGKEDNEMRCCDLEDQLDALRNKLCLSEERNSWYEEEHDLSDAVEYQKKLEADIRRRDFDLKQIKSKVNLQEDQVKYYSTMCGLFKDKIAERADIEFIEGQVKEKVQNYDNRLKSQNDELRRQVDVLERDRNDLMKRLRENAAQIGQKGTSFLGLSVDQLVQVMEFATNVRNGHACLPLNDKSLELTAQLASINVERTNDRITIERLEREIDEFKGVNELHGDDINMELNGMRHVLEEIQKQNNKLRNQINNLNNLDKAISPQRDKQKDIISPINQKRIEDIIGERLIDIPFKGQMQVICLIKEYDKLDQELSILKTSMHRWGYRGHNYKIRENQGNLNSKVDIDKDSNTLLKNNAQMISPLGLTSQQPRNSLVELSECGYQSQILETNVMKYEGHTTSTRHQHIGQSPCESNADSSRVKHISTQDIQIQVDINNTQIETVKLELIQTKEALRGGEYKILLQEKKINRLQSALKDSSQSKGGDRMVMAHATIKQLTQLLDEKNRVIRKYRKRNSVPSSVASEILKRLRCKDQDSIPRGDCRGNIDEETKSEGHASRLTPDTNVIELSSHNHEMDLLLREKENTIEKIEKRLRQVEASREVVIDEFKRLEVKFTELSLGQDTKEANTSTSTDNDDRAKNIEEIRNELEIKDAKMKRLVSIIKQMKVSQKQPDESSNQIEGLKKETERIRTHLSVTRRAKDKCERALILAESSNIEMTNDANRLQKENANLMYAQKTKRVAENKVKNMMVKFTQLQEMVRTTDANKAEEIQSTSKLIDKVMILQKENAKLRGNIASRQLKLQSEGEDNARSSRQKVALPSTQEKKEVPEKEQKENLNNKEGAKNMGAPSDESISKTAIMFDLAALEEARRALFSAKEENMRLTRLHKFEIPVRINQLKDEIKEAYSSRDNAYAKMDQLEIFLENQGYTEEICEWKGIRAQLEKEKKVRKEIDSQLSGIELMKKECCFDREQNINTKQVYINRITELTKSNKLLVQKSQEEAAREIIEVKVDTLEKNIEPEIETNIKQVGCNNNMNRNTPNINEMPNEKLGEARFSDTSIKILTLQQPDEQMKHTGSGRHHQEENVRLKSELRLCYEQQQSMKNVISNEVDAENTICCLEQEVITLREKLEACDTKRLKEVEKLQIENTEIKSMKDKLQRELKTFDLEFFEEIEDLKFKYNEALQLL